MKRNREYTMTGCSSNILQWGFHLKCLFRIENAYIRMLWSWENFNVHNFRRIHSNIAHAVVSPKNIIGSLEAWTLRLSILSTWNGPTHENTKFFHVMHPENVVKIKLTLGLIPGKYISFFGNEDNGNPYFFYYPRALLRSFLSLSKAAGEVN